VFRCFTCSTEFPRVPLFPQSMLFCVWGLNQPWSCPTPSRVIMISFLSSPRTEPFLGPATGPPVVGLRFRGLGFSLDFSHRLGFFEFGGRFSVIFFFFSGGVSIFFAPLEYPFARRSAFLKRTVIMGLFFVIRSLDQHCHGGGATSSGFFFEGTGAPSPKYPWPQWRRPFSQFCLPQTFQGDTHG